MYAVVRASGKQYKVAEGEIVKIDFQNEGQPGDTVKLDSVLMVQPDDGEAKVGQPTIEGAYVECTLVGHEKGKKIRVFKYKPKKRYQKTIGHRTLYTALKVEKIVAG